MVSVELAIGLVTVVTAAFGVLLAAVILAAAPSRGTNRTLAALVALNALQTLPFVFGTFVDNKSLDYYAWLSMGATLPSYFAIYPMFLGFALDTPWTRPLRSRALRVLLIEFMVVFPLALAFMTPEAFFHGEGTHVPNLGWTWEAGPIYTASLVFFIPVSIFGITAAVSALRRSLPGTVARSRAKAYLVAFATQDAGYGLVLGYGLFRPTDYNFFNLGNTAVTLAYSLLVAAALLRTQLFDFDLKLKIGVKRGTVTAVFVGAFLIVTAIAEQYLQQFGQDYGFVMGGAAVGVLLFAMRPIQRVAETFADRVFPGVSDDTNYIMRKKIEVYREALSESMLPTGSLDPSRTRDLRKLRGSMGLTTRDHEMLLVAVSGSPAGRRAPIVAPGATVLGKYRVERELGGGGGGHTFLAHDVRMSRPVVLKTISGGDPASAIREARAAAAIDHPHVVRIFDVEELGDQTLLVMEYVDGGSLRDRIASSGALSESSFARVADDVLAALEAVHATGAVHRDVKPSNVLLTRGGQAKLADFGIAHLPGLETTVATAPSGTVQYMSPEQARGKRVTALSDLYSAAATLYEARMGRPLVEARPGESAVEMQMRVGSGPRFDKNVKPPALQAWFVRALGPDDRFQTAAEMRKSLASALRSER